MLKRNLHNSVILFWTLIILKIGYTQTNIWYPTNGPFGGKIRAIIENQQGYLICSTYNENLFLSMDNGDNWTKINSLTNNIHNFALNDSGHIFAGATGNIFRSIDNGNNWSSIKNNLTYFGVNDIVINDQGYIFLGTSSGVYLSINNGEYWQSINSGLPIGSQVKSLAINDSGYIFAGIQHEGIYKSINNGQNWQSVNNGLATGYYYSLAVSSDGIIYAGIHDVGVYRSSDGGTSWIEMNNGLNNFSIRSIVTYDSNIVIVGTEAGIYKYDGNNWVESNPIKYKSLIKYLTLSSNGDILSATYGCGILQSSDSGNIWFEKNQGLEKQYIKDIAVNDSGHVYAITPDCIYKSDNQGNSWNIVKSGNMNEIAVHDNGNIFAGTENSGVYRSQDNGNSWIAVNNGLTNNNINSLEINDIGEIWVGTNRGKIFKSSDNGNSWISFYDSSLTLFGLDITAIAFNDSNHIFCAMTVGLANPSCAAGRVIKSKNCGLCWEEIFYIEPPWLGGITIDDIAIDDNNYIYLTADIYEGLRLSMDNGNSWIPINNGLQTYAIQSITILNNIIYLGTNGVFRSINNGSNWLPWNTGLENETINTVEFDQNSNGYAGTNHGIYHTNSLTGFERENNNLVTNFKLYQNYPNPFNSTTIIPFELPQKSQIEITIYDVTGKKIKTLVSGEFNGGVHNISWDGTNQKGKQISSSVYICTLKVSSISNKENTYIKSLKIIFLK